LHGWRNALVKVGRERELRESTRRERIALILEEMEMFTRTRRMLR